MRVTLLLIFLSLPAIAQNYPEGKVIPLEAIALTFGKHPFSARDFKFGEIKDRQKMAYEIVFKKMYEGQRKEAVIADLGPPTGYFGAEHVPAYRLTLGGKEEGKTIQLVFVLTRGRTVDHAIVQEQGSEVSALREQGTLDRALAFARKEIRK